MKIDCFLNIMSKHDVKMLAYENAKYGMLMMFNFEKESYKNVTDYFLMKTSCFLDSVSKCWPTEMAYAIKPFLLRIWYGHSSETAVFPQLKYPLRFRSDYIFALISFHYVGSSELIGYQCKQEKIQISQHTCAGRSAWSKSSLFTPI